MKFRVAEFTQENQFGNRFFVELGRDFFEVKKFWFFPYTTKILAWKPMINDEKNPHEGFKTMDDALYMIEELKKQLPIYHEIK